MPDLPILPAQVLPGSEWSGAQFDQGLAGGTIAAGQAVVLDPDTSTFRLTSSADPALALGPVVGLALHGASAGQPLRIQTAGPITLGTEAAPKPATIYALAATPGALAPATDLPSGQALTIVGIGGPNQTLILRIHATQQVIP